MSSLLLLPPLFLDVVLCLLFSKGLLRGRTALLTALAMQARGHELDAKTTRYTRCATTVWAAFAGLLALLISLGLLVDGWYPLAAATALSQGPLYLLLLVMEFLVRRHHLDHLEHMGFVDFVRFLRRVDYVAALRD
ncbi:MAG: hypothetical protein ACR2QH_08330 [Geminicoccaceae bacterium]